MTDKSLSSVGYIVSNKEISAILGLKERRIRQLAEEGALVRVSHGRYDLKASIQSYIEFTKTKEQSDSEIDKSEEEALWTRARREKTELEVKIIKGELHRSEDVERIMNQMLGAYRAKLLSIPSKLAPQLVGKSDVSDIKEKLKGVIYEAMKELADYDPGKFYEFSKDNLFLDEVEKEVSHNV